MKIKMGSGIPNAIFAFEREQVSLLILLLIFIDIMSFVAVALVCFSLCLFGKVGRAKSVR